MISKYDIFKSTDNYFRFDENKKEIVEKLLDRKKYMTTSEVLHTMKKYALSGDIVNLCVNHPSIYTYDLERFVEENFIEHHNIPHECIVDAILKRESGYGGTRLLFRLMDINSIYDELYNNVGKQTKLSQDTLLALSDIYRVCDFKTGLSEEFACIYAHIKFPEYIEDVILKDENFISQLDNDTRERLFSAIASNIHLPDKLRNSVFDMGCNYDMIKSPTEYMQKAIYLGNAETFFDIDDNTDDINLSNTIEGAFKRLNIMIKKGLSEECEIDMLNRINSSSYQNSKLNKLAYNIFTHTKNANTLLKVVDFSNPSVIDAAYANPRMPSMMIIKKGLISVDKLCTYLDKFNEINKTVFARVEKGMEHGEYDLSTYRKLLKYNHPEIDVSIALAKTTPMAILEEMKSKNDSIIINTLISLNMAMKSEGLDDLQRERVKNLFNDAQKYGNKIIEKGTFDMSRYSGPRPQNRAELAKFIRVFEKIGVQKDFPQSCIDGAIETLNLRLEARDRNQRFDIEHNTTYKLKQMRANMIKNLQNNQDEIWVYKNIDKIINLIDKIDEELKNREMTKDKEIKDEYNR